MHGQTEVIASPRPGHTFEPTWIHIVLCLAMFMGMLAAQDPARAQNTSRQLRMATGTLSRNPRALWRFKTGGPVTSSAVVENGRVYIGSGDGNVYCLRLSDGARLWSVKTGGTVEAQPLVIEGAVFVGSADGILYALDAINGRLLWRYRTEDKIVGGANWAPSTQGRGSVIVVGSYDNKVHCVAAGTGQRLWTYQTNNYVNGMPAVSRGQVIFGGCDGILYVVRLADGRLTRSIAIKNYIAGSVAVDDRYAFLGHYGGEAVCADVVGGQVLWRLRNGNFPFFSSPAVSGNRIVIGSRDKSVYCLAYGSGHFLWKFRTRGKVDSSPVICDYKVVVGSEDGRLYMFRLSDGVNLWSYAVGAPIISSPIVAGGRIIVGSNDGYVWAFG